MEIIIHRINKIKELKEIDKNFGLEIDIRTKNSKIILNHEPYSQGDLLENYLSNYKHGTLILNIKEAGIEDDVLRMVKNFTNIKNFFLLDVEIPYLFKCMEKNEKNVAVRLSMYEPIDLAKKFSSKFNWLWIDTYKSLPINKKDLKIINKFKKCLVCPERWGMENKIKHYYKIIKKYNVNIDSVMTSKKFSNTWLNLIK